MARKTLYQRVWDKVDKSGPCWLWTGSLSTRGYARIQEGGRRFTVHRLTYEWAIGPIPEGMQLDHLCRVRHCVLPSHLEPVDNRTNVLRGVGLTAQNARKTHCAHGHEFTPENTWIKSTKVQPYRRYCLACKKLENARHLALQALDKENG